MSELQFRYRYDIDLYLFRSLRRLPDELRLAGPLRFFSHFFWNGTETLGVGVILAQVLTGIITFLRPMNSIEALKETTVYDIQQIGSIAISA